MLHSLLRRVAALQDQVAWQQETIARHAPRIERSRKDKKRLAKKLEEALRTATRQAIRPGRDHGPVNLRPPPDHVDKSYAAALPLDCPHCGGEVEVDDVQPQYQWDLPPDIFAIVREFKVQIGPSQQCRKRLQAQHADDTGIPGLLTIQRQPGARPIVARAPGSAGPHLTIAPQPREPGARRPGATELTVSPFDQDRQDAYRTVIDFVVIASEIAAPLPRGRGYLADQPQRAATSIPLNIGEGAGELSSGDKARFSGMARRSATECAAILDVCQRLRLVTQRAFTAARELPIRIVSTLVRLVRSLDGQAHAVTAVPEPTKPGTATTATR